MHTSQLWCNVLNSPCALSVFLLIPVVFVYLVVAQQCSETSSTKVSTNVFTNFTKIQRELKRKNIIKLSVLRV